MGVLQDKVAKWGCLNFTYIRGTFKSLLFSWVFWNAFSSGRKGDKVTASACNSSKLTLCLIYYILP